MVKKRCALESMEGFSVPDARLASRGGKCLSCSNFLADSSWASTASASASASASAALSISWLV